MESTFECRARRQGTAGGNDPADCDFPHCGCDAPSQPMATTAAPAVYLEDVKLAKKICAYLGHATSESLEPGDHVRDHVAKMLAEYRYFWSQLHRGIGHQEGEAALRKVIIGTKP